MAGVKRRAASTASGSTQATQRIPSRASTESVHSGHTRNSPHPLDFQLGQRPAVASNTPGIPEQQQQQQQSNVLHPLEAMLRAGTALNSPSLDPALQMSGDFATSDILSHAAVTRGSSYSGLSQEAYNSPNLATNTSINGGAGPLSGVEMVDDTKRKRGSTCTATNDRELRELISRNEGRGLKDVATEVIATERTSRAEKSKQLFAMIWLRSMCKSAKNSVPRNRVYAHYARRCGTERVTPLNPASFGKLVRVIFPGIQTRRLGVRGESKYHYVDLALVDESVFGDSQRTYNSTSAQGQHVRQESVSTQMDYKLPVDTAAFPPQDQDFDTPQQQPSLPQESSKPSQAGLFADPFTPGLGQTGPTSTMYKHTLKFPPAEHASFMESDAIELPDIRPYCPPKTDLDSLEALSALYRTHCTSLIDCVRFCKEKQFFRLYTSFHGTLTMPVQKLFAHPHIAPWIRECDWLMYQKMVRFVSQLTLQVAPPVVLKFLDTISKMLHGHLSRTFQGHPLHVLEAKLEPATLFAGLLHRMLRVNSTAHAAAALLMIDQTRDQMWADWVQYVNPKRIMESELPHCGAYADVHTILVDDIRKLLAPMKSPTWLENQTHYQQNQQHNGTNTPFSASAMHMAYNSSNGMANGTISTDLSLNFDPSLSGNANLSNETVIDRLATFLMSLPARFPNTDTRTLLYCISALGTAALREITVENGLSYQPWWITKVFVDEMSLWLASMGGFLDHKAPAAENVGREGEKEGEGGKERVDERVGGQQQPHQQGTQSQQAQQQQAQQMHHEQVQGLNIDMGMNVNGNGSIHDAFNHSQFDNMTEMDFGDGGGVGQDPSHQHQHQQQQQQQQQQHYHGHHHTGSNGTALDISPLHQNNDPFDADMNNNNNNNTTTINHSRNHNQTNHSSRYSNSSNTHNITKSTPTSTSLPSNLFTLSHSDRTSIDETGGSNANQNHDDSGIGISLMDDDDVVIDVDCDVVVDGLGLGKYDGKFGIGSGGSGGVVATSVAAD